MKIMYPHPLESLQFDNNEHTFHYLNAKTKIQILYALQTNIHGTLLERKNLHV